MGLERDGVYYGEEWFDGAYRDQKPPWDIQKPQPDYVALADEGVVKGRVLEVGCGTGENALLFAGRGLDVMGVDASPTAIGRAQAKAVERSLSATFKVHDVTKLGELNETFDCIIDSGLFHVLSDAQRGPLAEGAAAVLRPGGTYYMLTFSDEEPVREHIFGPRRVSKEDLEATFGKWFRIAWVRQAGFLGTIMCDGTLTRKAWLAALERNDTGVSK